MTTLDSRSERRSLRLAILDGILYATMVGFGESYFVLDAVRLRATPFQLGLVVGLPLAIGAIGPLCALALLRRLRTRRGLVATAAGLQGLLCLGLPAIGELGDASVWALISAVSLYQAFGQAAGTAWSSWYGDLVPPGIRARYFARRTRIVQFTIFLGLVLGGLVLQNLEPGGLDGGPSPGGGAGFRVVFTIAGVARLASALTLALSPEPRFRGMPAPRGAMRFLRTRRGANARRLVLAASSLNVLVYVSSPFFEPFMRKADGLAFSYLECMVAKGAVVALKVLSLPAWGKAIDRYGPRQVFALAAVLLSLVPLPWVFAESLPWILLAQAYSGFAWGGYEVALFALMLGVSYPKTRPLVFAAHSILNGSGQLAGTLLGGALLGVSGADYRLVFAVSLVGRLVIGLFAARLVPDRTEGPELRRRDLLLRVIGIRAHGGVTHRPVLVDPPRRSAATSRDSGHGGGPVT